MSSESCHNAFHPSQRPSPPRPAEKPTPERVLALVAAHRAAFRQERTARRLTMLAIGLLCAFSRHTLTQVLVALGLGDRDWRAAYRLCSVPASPATSSIAASSSRRSPTSPTPSPIWSSWTASKSRAAAGGREGDGTAVLTLDHESARLQPRICARPRHGPPHNALSPAAVSQVAIAATMASTQPVTGGRRQPCSQPE